MIAANHRSERCWSVAPEYQNRRLRLIVADGTPRYAEAVRNVLEFHEMVDLVGRATNFEETIQLVVSLRPDLVLMDMEMPSAMVAIAATITIAADVQIVGMFNACLPLQEPALILSVAAFVDKARLASDFLPVLHAVIRRRAASWPLVPPSRRHGAVVVELPFRLKRS